MQLCSLVDLYGIWYLAVSFLWVIMLQNANYYFSYRGFHHLLVYSWLYRGHHRSKQTTPWTSFALDFPEVSI